MQTGLPDLRSKRFCIFGLQGSGKSYLARRLLQSDPAHFVYDVMHEHAGCNRYLATHRQYTPEAVAELDLLVRRVVIGSGKVRLFVLDEASRYCPNRRPLPDSIAELNDLQRHYDIALGFIARRPVQLSTDLVELAHYLFIFTLRGKNDLLYLDSLASGLADAVAGLEKYHFVVVYPQRRFSVCKPIS